MSLHVSRAVQMGEMSDASSSSSSSTRSAVEATPVGEQEQDHNLTIELDAVVNWLENLDLGEKCELSSGLEAE
eukprot:SAG31_NODE_371_length_16628_cov_3.741943_2_plen_73_part_00